MGDSDSRFGVKPGADSVFGTFGVGVGIGVNNFFTTGVGAGVGVNIFFDNWSQSRSWSQQIDLESESRVLESVHTMIHYKH